jgi:hypothetical protein
MSECEALDEARRRWGREAHVRLRQGTMLVDMKPYAVGRWHGTKFQMLGQGQSWEEAFQAAKSQ